MAGWELIGQLEKKAINKLIDKENRIFLAHGYDKIRKKYHVREFEKACSKKFKSKYCVCVSSGTAAIKIGLKALGVKPGDEVITQAFNFIATIEAILDVGAIPIIANVNKTLNMDPEELEKLITKKTKVIIPVHMLGVAAEINKIKKIAKKRKIKILEDNCESVGALFQKNFLGTLGDVGVFSFDFGKMITTGGEGGLVLTQKKSIHKFVREYHDHGHENNPKFARGNDTKKIYGFNYRMSEIQGVLGKVQLRRLDYIIKDNKNKYEVLKEKLKELVDIRVIPKNTTSAYDCFIFQIANEDLRKRIVNFLNKKGFGTKNLPDAIKWHCSYFWPHALKQNQVNRSKKTFEILSKMIAIPIWQRKKLKDYIKLGQDLKKFL